MRLHSIAALGVVTILLAGCGGGGGSSGSSATHAGTGGTSTAPSTSTSTGTSTNGTAGATNGVASQAPTQIVAAASQALETARSVHVVGAIVDNGIQIRLNLRLSRGRGGQGEISENGLGFRLISTGKLVYIQGSDAFWNHFGGTRAAKLFHGKWLRAPDAGQFATLGKLASIQGLAGQLLSRRGKPSRSGHTTIDGQPAVGVTERTQGSTLFVATRGRPYPLEIVKRGASGGYVKFTSFNQPVTITPPRKSVSLPSFG